MAAGTAVGGGDTVSAFDRVRRWLGARGRPGTPRMDLVPLAAFLDHELTADEILDIATDLTRRSDAEGRPVSDHEIRTAIAEWAYLDPTDADVASVRAVLDRTSRSQPAGD